MDAVRRDRLEDSTLTRGLPDEEEMPVFEVPNAAVDDLRRAARRAEGEVGLVHERDGPATQGGIAGDPHPSDAPADDEHIDRAGRHPLEG